MKKHINLYQASCYPQREKGTFIQFVALVGGCLLFVFFLMFFLNKQLSDTQNIAEQHKRLLINKEAELSELVLELKKNRVPNKKVNELSNLQNEVTAKKNLLASLAGIELGMSVNFSELMRGLSLADMSAITIQAFSIIDGHLNISGEAKYSDSVALWLKKVQKTEELSSVSFDQLSIIGSDDTNVFTFKLSNLVEDKPEKVVEK